MANERCVMKTNKKVNQIFLNLNLDGFLELRVMIMVAGDLSLLIVLAGKLFSNEPGYSIDRFRMESSCTEVAATECVHR